MGKTMGEVAHTEQWCRLSVLVGWVLLQLSSLCTAQNQDTCFMTLVLPKEKVKHTCDVQEAVLKRLDALEGQIAYQKTIIKDLEQMLMKERDMKDNGRETAGTQKQTSDPQHKEPPTDGFQVDPGTQPIPDDEYFIPLPDLSDDYPDFVDYSLPDVEGRSGGGFTKKSPKKNSARGSKSGSSRGTNLVAIELIRPYVHAQLDKLRANLTRRISQTVYPFAAGFEEVKKFLLRNQSQDSSVLSPGAQTSMNTIALSHLFLQVSNLHNKLLHYNTHQIAAQKRVSVVERRLLALSQNSGQKTKDLQARITQLEHENQLLKINQSCVSQMSEMKLDISRQISEAKDNIRLNCKTRRRPPRNRARSAQGDYYYDDDEGFEDDNSIYDNPLPLSELEKNVTILQNLVAQHRHQLEAVNRKHGLTWNSTRAALEQESVDRELGDRQVNDTSLLGLVKVKLQVGELNELVQKVSSTAAGIQADMEEKQQTLTRQLAALKRLTTDLHEDTTKNFTWHSSRINNLSHSLATNIAALQKSDRELSLAMKQGLGRSNQRLTESSIRIKQNNNTLIVLSDELRSLSEQVHVTVLNLNESVLNLGVEMRLNNVTWIPYNFSHSMGHVKCYGEKYIKKTSYESGKIVGVVLCTKDMYKIFLSDSLTDTFLDIADSSGFGRDHCEFIGGNRERTALLGNTPVFYKRERGYKRAGWGEQPKVTTLWVMNPSPEWYRCGVSIPS